MTSTASMAGDLTTTGGGAGGYNGSEGGLRMLFVDDQHLTPGYNDIRLSIAGTGAIKTVINTKLQLYFEARGR